MRRNEPPSRKTWPSMSQTDRMSQLSPRRREIIRPAFENPRQFVLLSVRDMAKKLGTDPATTVRIARGLGFESYKEFQRYLHELSVVRATSLDTMQAASPADSSVNSLLRECLNQEVKNFRALYNGLDLNRLEKVARRLWKARRILGKEDVVIAVSFRRGLRMTIEGIQQARKLGAYCVGITDTYISPVARFSDEFFLTPVDTTSFDVSYSAPMCLFNVLLSAMAEVQRTKTLQIIKKVAEEQRHGFRFYEE